MVDTEKQQYPLSKLLKHFTISAVLVHCPYIIGNLILSVSTIFLFRKGLSVKWSREEDSMKSHYGLDICTIQARLQSRMLRWRRSLVSLPNSSRPNKACADNPPSLQRKDRPG